MKFFIFLFLFATLSAQLYPLKNKGDVFNSKPSKPLENIDKTGLIVVKRTLYGLYFEDRNLSDETKNRITVFFNHQYRGFTDFKTYRLTIYRKKNIWYIDNHKL